MYPNIPTIKTASRNKKFEQWVIYMQKRERNFHCPRCSQRLKKKSTVKSMLCDQIWICTTCRYFEEYEWDYIKRPPLGYQDWDFFKSFSEVCQKHAVNWHMI